ncbi:MAG: 16S rRNA (adenine(1518)-N(6)/adenine(1519)-N(6))-dimethyltransferase RsmA [Candidatus Sigynarchaeota archaeon]
MADHIFPVFLTVPEIKHVLEQLGQVPKKRHGQNFIHAWPAIHRILDICAFVPGDSVIEIGPGLGAFTLNIAQRVKHVHAIELNPKFARFLQQKARELGITNFQIENANALHVNFPEGYSVVFSAMPYSISAPLTFKVLDYMQRHRARAFLTCQKEFGEKLAAKPGSMDYGRVTANVSFFAHVDLAMHVSRNNFYPIPDVDSVLVRLSPRDPLPRETVQAYTTLTRGLFPYKNKVLRRAMALLAEKELGYQLEPGLLDAMPFKEKRVRELTAEDLQTVAGWYASISARQAMNARRA